MDTPQMSLERFYLIVGDLGHAQKFASYILTRGLHEKKGEKTKLVHRALNLSMIVSYCRPFARNRVFFGRRSNGVLKPTSGSSYTVTFDFTDASAGESQAIWTIDLLSCKVQYINKYAKYFSYLPPTKTLSNAMQPTAK